MMEHICNPAYGKKAAKAARRKGAFAHFLRAAALLNIGGMAFVIVSLLRKTTASGLNELFASADTWVSIQLSLVSVAFSAVLIVLIGTPVAYYLSKTRSRTIHMLSNFIYLPMVFPPAVTGLALLSAFGRNSFVGHQLEIFNFMLPFSFAGVVLVQVFVSLPFFVQIVSNGFMTVDSSIDEAARLYGADERQLLTQIYIPMARPAIYSGIIMSMLRSAGEFGATIMFAGNLAGKTQTVTTRIYSLFQQDISQAAALAAVQLFVFILPLFLLKLKFNALERYA